MVFLIVLSYFSAISFLRMYGISVAAQSADGKTGVCYGIHKLLEFALVGKSSTSGFACAFPGYPPQPISIISIPIDLK